MCTQIQKQLFQLQDKKYQEFQSRLMPGIPKDTVIGVRTPLLRKMGKEFRDSHERKQFLQSLPHRYYEENNLHGIFIEQIQDYQECINALDEFLPFVNNWATCDLISPKIFQKRKKELLPKIKNWMNSSDTYTIRFGIKMLMTHYLGENFSMEYPIMVLQVPSKEYYVSMMKAWYFATALAMQYQAILPFFQEHKIEPWTHNKAIQKAIESRRISQEQKEELKILKVKIKNYL